MGELAQDYGLRCVIVIPLAYHLLILKNVGNLLLKRLLVAITSAGTSKTDFVGFDSSLREENLAEVVKMQSDLDAWTKDHSSRPDPYRLPKSSECRGSVYGCYICLSNQPA
jgi:hypothetical protein